MHHSRASSGVDLERELAGGLPAAPALWALPCVGAALALLVCGCASGTTDSRDGDSRDANALDLRVGDAPRVDVLARDGGPGEDQLTPSDGPVVDVLPQPDSVVPDQAVDGPPASDGGSGPNVGAPCTGSGDCRGGTACLLDVGGVKICTLSCTLDDLATGSNEDSCPLLGQNICAEIPLAGGGTGNYCLQRCQPQDNANECPGALACEPTSRYSRLQGVATCLVPACKTHADCPVFTAKSCTPGTGAGCSSAAGEYCVAGTGGSGRCALPGVCQPQNGLCGPHTQGAPGVSIGAPCAADTDCGDGMSCLDQQTVSGVVVFRNGYCSISGCGFPSLSAAQCPSGSTCNRRYPSGLCQRLCSILNADTCRNHVGDYRGDYECYGWNNFTIGAQPVATAPVCDLAVSCTAIPATSTCAALGVAGNFSAMACRDPVSHAILPAPTAAGRCLDDTTSGPGGP